MKTIVRMLFLPVLLLVLSASASAAEKQYEVYYFHASWRCTNCNNAEAYTEEAVNSFKAQNPSINVAFLPVQLETNADLVKAVRAKRVDVVVVEVKEGKIVRHKNLGNMLPLVGNKANVVNKVKDGVAAFVKSSR